MDLLFQYNQTKKFKNTDTVNRCSLRLYEFENLIHFVSEYSFNYLRYGTKNTIEIEHLITVNLTNGDINCTYRIGSQPSNKVAVTKPTMRTNNFSMLYEMLENGFYRGEKRRDYWGRRFNKAIDNLLFIMEDKLSEHLKDSFYKDKDYLDEHTVSPLYDLIVDLHLHKKKIKAHDSVYHTIQYDYPKTKWLKLNDYKFLPAVLDSHGIKTKYLIGEVNKLKDKRINIKTLSRLCKLFGENYIDYIKQFDWVTHSSVYISRGKIHQLKNESEKKNLIKVLNNWEKTILQEDTFIELINKMLSTRDFLESKNLKLKFDAKDDESFEVLLNTWENMKNHFKKGYRVRYSLPDSFIQEIEEPITVNNKVFKPSIIRTEEDFIIEGYLMKNCMSKQFQNGAIFVYVSMTHEKTRINLQYKKGILGQHYGKANTPVNDKTFQNAIDILNKRFSKYVDLQWYKEKFDYINN
jgi:hypothetical protein